MDSDNLNMEVSNDENVSYFSFGDDELLLEEKEEFINDVIRNKNEYLISKGYVIDDNGQLIAPNNMVKDGIIGFAVADALGVSVEFCSRSKLEKEPLREMIGFGTHLVPEGTWSDDTSMMLATMDSIIENNIIDYDDMMGKFYEWLEDAKYTALDTNFDIGITTKNAILKYKNGFKSLMCGAVDRKSNGNGSLMRMLPIACYLYNNNYDISYEVEIINNVSSLTHSHEISRLGCKIYVDYVKLLLDGVDKIDAFKRLMEIGYDDYYTRETIFEYKRILSGDIVNLSKEDIKSTGYVVDTLEASLWSFLNTDNYKDAVITAINLGGDTDTIGAITGSMSGIFYGGKQIPREWLYKLRKRDYVNDMCKKFVASLRNDEVTKHR